MIEDLATHEQSRRRPRAWIVVCAGLMVLMALLVGIVSGRSDPPLSVASTCPDTGPVSTLSEEQQQVVDDVENLACLGEPETTTTSTSIDPTSTTIEPLVDGSLPPAQLTGSKDGLEITVDVRPPELKTADILTLDITARDMDGGEMAISVRWEPDRGGTVRSHRDCARSQPKPTAPSVETKETSFSYRTPGVVPIAVTVESTYCAHWDIERKTLKVEGKVVVGPGPLLSNGPMPLDLEASVSSADSTPTTTALGVWASEVDGFIHTVDIDWGDGSPHHVVSTPLDQCDDPLHTWPGPSRFSRLVRHDYPAGTYVARITVRSSGCKGLDEQVRTVEVPIE